MKPLSRSFYARETLVVARALLGQRLCVRKPSGTLHAGRIVEVEAYLGLVDRASHARLKKRGGKLVPTERSALMFGPSGFAYVYLIYGMHNCFNVVAHAEGAVGAILVRALEPLPGSPDMNLRGPARLCAALEIDRRHNGLDLCAKKAELFIAAGDDIADSDVAAGPRIGVDYAGDDALLPYRLCVRGSRHLSRPLAPQSSN